MPQERSTRSDSIKAPQPKIVGIGGNEDLLLALQAALADDPAENVFSHLTHLAAGILRASIGLIMIFDEGRLVFRNNTRLPESWTTPHGDAHIRLLGLQAAQKRGILRAANVERHPLLRNHPAVAELEIAAYAAVPLEFPDLPFLGVISVFDHEQRSWTSAQYAMLDDIAALARVEVEHRLELVTRGRFEEQLDKMRDAAEKASGAKSEFLANMSHEFRTPLNAIMAYAELLLAGVPEPLPAASREQVQRIRTSTRHLQQLVQEILAFSRLEAEREHIHLESVKIQDLVQAAAELVEPLAAGKRLALRVEAPADPVEIQTDPGKLRQILLNLLGNAVKYTESGEVSLIAESLADQIILHVRDTGPGMDAEELDRIFDPFWQVYQTGEEGFGLGLSITEALVRLLNGEIHVRSARGRGSTFTVRLPHRQQPAAKRTA